MNMRGMGKPREGEPLETVSRPFDLTRDGFVLGEGAGAMMLEDLEHAKARGARVYAEVVGLRLGRGRLGPHPADREGRRHPPGLSSRRSSATTCRPNEIDLINPHGTSTPLGDLREAQAIWATFGEHTPEGGDQRHQVADRPPDGRGRARSRAWPRC